MRELDGWDLPGGQGRSYRMRVACSFALAALTVAVTVATAATGTHVVAANGVKLSAPPGWLRVRAASDGPVTDPRTLLVVGTSGVRARPSQCQIAAYRVPAGSAVVVVVGWRSLKYSGAANAERGYAPLKRLVAVRRPSFECFAGRGAAAGVVIGDHPYQVNVMIGERASRSRVAEALAVGRSFRLAP